MVKTHISNFRITANFLGVLSFRTFTVVSIQHFCAMWWRLMRRFVVWLAPWITCFKNNKPLIIAQTTRTEFTKGAAGKLTAGFWRKSYLLKLQLILLHNFAILNPSTPHYFSLKLRMDCVSLTQWRSSANGNPLRNISVPCFILYWDTKPLSIQMTDQLL